MNEFWKQVLVSVLATIILTALIGVFSVSAVDLTFESGSKIIYKAPPQK